MCNQLAVLHWCITFSMRSRPQDVHPAPKRARTCARTISAPLRRAHSSSCSAAAARNVSPAASTTWGSKEGEVQKGRVPGQSGASELQIAWAQMMGETAQLAHVPLPNIAIAAARLRGQPAAPSSRTLAPPEANLLASLPMVVVLPPPLTPTTWRSKKGRGGHAAVSP